MHLGKSFHDYLINFWILFSFIPYCRILYDKRFSVFHFPVMDEDAPNYHAIIQNPMDMATLLQCVDSGKYITCKSFLEDFDLILTNAKVRVQLKLVTKAANMPIKRKEKSVAHVHVE